MATAVCFWLPFWEVGSLKRVGFLPLRETRSAMSMLASVVSLGSPGSAMWSTCAWACSRTEAAEARSELARWRLAGLEPVAVSDLRCVSLPVSGAVVSPSSPEASREEGCSSGLSSIMAELAVVERFRLPAWDELEGEDILGSAPSNAKT